MEYVQEPPLLPADQHSVVTLGKFNGLHRGHQKLINRVQKAGEESHWKKTVYSFSGDEPRLLTQAESRQLLDQLGMDLYIDARLDQKLMQVSPEDFVKDFLVQKLHAALVVVGIDYRFGYQRKGTAEKLKAMGNQFGFAVDILTKEKDGEREISSTYIREELHDGHMERVNDLLGYPFSVTGTVVHGQRLGRSIGFPTINFYPSQQKLMPRSGVYITRSCFGDTAYTGVTNIGYKPTVGTEERLGVETHLLHCREDLYGCTPRVEFYRFLRPERKFPSLEALQKQLAVDAQMGEAWDKTQKASGKEGAVH